MLIRPCWEETVVNFYELLLVYLENYYYCCVTMLPQSGISSTEASSIVFKKVYFYRL